MTVIAVTVTDATPVPTKWEMPLNYVGLRSPIPRGLLTYRGTSAIALLGAGDETAYRLNLEFPVGFFYLPKVLQLRYKSDDLVAQFNDRALGNYGGSGVQANFNMVSPGIVISLAVTGIQVWTPALATPKLFIQGRAGSTGQTFFASDMSSGGSTAGDMQYFMQYYVFDVDQVDKWEPNTPIPVISHTSF